MLTLQYSRFGRREVFVEKNRDSFVPRRVEVRTVVPGSVGDRL